MSEWTTKHDYKKCEAKDCSYADSLDTGAIRIPPEIYAVIRTLCKDIDDEWQMLLKGEVKDGDVLVDGYYIPKQEVSGASVKNLDCIDKAFITENRIIATIHSHSSMGVFFSPTDEEMTNFSMINYHIVTNNKGEFTACMKIDLPCELAKLYDTRVIINLPDTTEEKIEGLDNIEKCRTKIVTYKGQSHWHRESWKKHDNPKIDGLWKDGRWQLWDWVLGKFIDDTERNLEEGIDVKEEVVVDETEKEFDRTNYAIHEEDVDLYELYK